MAGNCADYSSRTNAARASCQPGSCLLESMLHGNHHPFRMQQVRREISSAIGSQRFVPKTAARSMCGTIWRRSAAPQRATRLPPDQTNMWRYAAVLPDAEPVTLGEGFTPLLPSRKYPNLLIKDEGLNPTGSFKARGMSAAITMARHYGLKKLAAPSAGNAGGALAAYAAAAGLEAYVFMPKDVPHRESAGGGSCGRAPDAGRWTHQRLWPHGCRAQRAGGLVRCLDAEGAVSRRGQEDYGLRGRRADGMDAARRDSVSHGRRRWLDRNVEGVRRDGRAGLDRGRQAARR